TLARQGRSHGPNFSLETVVVFWYTFVYIFNWSVMMPNDFQDKIAAAKAELTAAKHLLQSEIRAYPTPISGCDAQFNHLIGERTRVLDALELLEASVFVATPRMLTQNAGIESR
ncbi:MAG: hypothetical protein AAFP98_02005, partial [Pseudomonadota bacterium]